MIQKFNLKIAVQSTNICKFKIIVVLLTFLLSACESTDTLDKKEHSVAIGSGWPPTNTYDSYYVASKEVKENHTVSR